MNWSLRTGHSHRKCSRLAEGLAAARQTSLSAEGKSVPGAEQSSCLLEACHPRANREWPLEHVAEMAVRVRLVRA